MDAIKFLDAYEASVFTRATTDSACLHAMRQFAATLPPEVAGEDAKDAKFFRWIISNCTTNVGGFGFELQAWIPVDSDCWNIRKAIAVAIAAQEGAERSALPQTPKEK